MIYDILLMAYKFGIAMPLYFLLFQLFSCATRSITLIRFIVMGVIPSRFPLVWEGALYSRRAFWKVSKQAIQAAGWGWDQILGGHLIKWRNTGLLYQLRFVTTYLPANSQQPTANSQQPTANTGDQ